MSYFTIAQIKRANADAGHHFFERSTMRFFDSRIASRHPIGGRYFVTSERFSLAYPRLYTVRECGENGHVNTVGKFQAYITVEAAKRAAEQLAREDTENWKRENGIIA